MAYLGNKPVNNFVSFAKQNITGNGGTSYSLDYPVTGANDIELFINNVRQEPTEAYSCAGSTLTLTGAVSSTDDVYVIFRGRALQTAQHPSDSALEAASAIIDTNTFVVDAVNNRVGIGTSAPSHLADVQGSGADQTLMRFRSSGTSSAAKLEFLGTNTGGSGSQVAHITVSQPSGGQNTDTKMDFLVRKSGDAFDSPGVGLSIDRGYVTMPRQPSMLAQPDSNGTVAIGSNNSTVFGWYASGGIRHNNGFTISGYSGAAATKFNASNTGVITVPSDGRYLIYFDLRCEAASGGGDGGAGQMAVFVNGSWVMRRHTNHWGNDPYTHEEISAVLELSANDYLSFGAWWNNGNSMGGDFQGYSDKVNWLYIAKIS